MIVLDSRTFNSDYTDIIDTKNGRRLFLVFFFLLMSFAYEQFVRINQKKVDQA